MTKMAMKYILEVTSIGEEITTAIVQERMSKITHSDNKLRLIKHIPTIQTTAQLITRSKHFEKTERQEKPKVWRRIK
tara:strand:+ start:1222 stop:1452 length:231 start_codon:yes stop_codon:yes gene_type:complete